MDFTMVDYSANVDPRELAKFEAASARWWDPTGEFRTLHDINPLRLGYIETRAGLEGKQVADVGCGGGILSEALAGKGASVIGIDASETSLGVARLHQLRSKANVSYVNATPEQYAAEHAGQFDVVVCMELLEHVPQPSMVVGACAKLAKPGGHVFFSTINRTPLAYLLAVVGAEYVLQLLPKGTHDYARFIQPAELVLWARASGMTVRDISGMFYNPVTRQGSLTSHVAVNYLVHARLNDVPSA
jgi:2-polyprenyl-6-hydroxyphenyl methylase/3-demethylubiquinone-9 3-methyltransferase